MTNNYRDLAPEAAQYSYCPRCAGGLTDRVDDVNDRIRPTCARCGWIYYPTNLSGALVVAETDDSIVLIRPPDADGGGAALPGGIAEYGETPEQCAVREMAEETGLEIDGLIEISRTLIHNSFGPMLHFGFRARVVGGALREGDEGPAVLLPRGTPAPIATNRIGSRTVYDAYLAERRTR